MRYGFCKLLNIWLWLLRLSRNLLISCRRPLRRKVSLCILYEPNILFHAPLSSGRAACLIYERLGDFGEQLRYRRSAWNTAQCRHVGTSHIHWNVRRARSSALTPAKSSTIPTGSISIQCRACQHLDAASSIAELEICLYGSQYHPEQLSIAQECIHKFQGSQVRLRAFLFPLTLLGFARRTAGKFGSRLRRLRFSLERRLPGAKCPARNARAATSAAVFGSALADCACAIAVASTAFNVSYVSMSAPSAAGRGWDGRFRLPQGPEIHRVGLV